MSPFFFLFALESHRATSGVCKSVCYSGAFHGLRSKSRHATGKGRISNPRQVAVAHHLAAAASLASSQRWTQIRG